MNKGHHCQRHPKPRMMPSIPTSFRGHDFPYHANAHGPSRSRVVGENKEKHNKRDNCGSRYLQKVDEYAFLFSAFHCCFPKQPFMSMPTEARSAPIPTPVRSFPAPLLNLAKSSANARGAVWIPKIFANAPAVASTPFVDVVFASTAPTTVEPAPSAIAPTIFASAPRGLAVNATPAASRRREPALLLSA